MKFGVVVFPGSNCDDDMIHVLGTVMGQEVHKLWHKDTDALNTFTKDDCIVLPGGFSYGDYLRSGAIASHSPIMASVIEFANNGGYVWGICNGFQVLCEAGLLPGALLNNNQHKFICKNIYLRTETDQTAITSQLRTKQVIKVPIAHADGRYYADDATIKQLNENGQVLFRYCSEGGDCSDNYNPNGSLENIAGICNENRNVFGMMPHPERCAEPTLGNEDGRALFESILALQKEMV
jgi:phosphoribosylformylglycinamidine synthase I